LSVVVGIGIVLVVIIIVVLLSRVSLFSLIFFFFFENVFEVALFYKRGNTQRVVVSLNKVLKGTTTREQIKRDLTTKNTINSSPSTFSCVSRNPGILQPNFSSGYSCVVRTRASRIGSSTLPTRLDIPLAFCEYILNHESFSSLVLLLFLLLQILPFEVFSPSMFLSRV
jgi:hypothetical protein